jgi:hypothetical protein
MLVLPCAGKQCSASGEIDDIGRTWWELAPRDNPGMNTLLMLPYDYVLILGFGRSAIFFPIANIAARRGD